MADAQAAHRSRRHPAGASTSALKAMRAQGRDAEAREQFAELVARHQRRASRIAFHYLRDGAEADEAVREAFVEAYSQLGWVREDLPFEVWLHRILINGCLDRIARSRHKTPTRPAPVTKLSGAVARLPEPERLIFMLSYDEAFTSFEVSALTGLHESTVRVHMSRAIHRLRTLLTEPG